jgi:amidase
VTGIAFRDAGELARMVRAREISSRELTDLYIGRIEEHDETLNAVVVRDFERAREAARVSRARCSRRARPSRDCRSASRRSVASTTTS